MERTDKQLLEEKSRTALRSLLQDSCLLSDITRDFGLDMDLKIIEDGKISNKVFWIQLKATHESFAKLPTISLPIDIKHLVYYEQQKLPVLIIYWSEPDNIFYCIFAQKYIIETLYIDDPDWKSKKTKSLKFTNDNKLLGIDDINSINEIENNYIDRKEQFSRIDRLIFKASKMTNFKLNINRKLATRYIFYLPLSIIFIAIIYIIMAISISSYFVQRGDKYALQSEYGIAAINFHKAYIYSSSFRYKRGESLSLFRLADCNVIQGNNEMALDYYNQSIRISRENGYIKNEANALIGLGDLNEKLGNNDLALKNIQDAYVLFQQLDYQIGLAHTLNAFAQYYSNNSKIDLALVYANQSKKIYNKIDEKHDLANVLLVIIKGSKVIWTIFPHFHAAA